MYSIQAKLLWKALLYMLYVYIVAVYVPDETTSVTTSLGVINGQLKKSEFRGQQLVTKQFLGIRYGNAPVGELRFQKPEPAPRLSSPLNATQFGSPCPQTDGLSVQLYSTNEDCLFLNVVVPTQDPDQDSGHAVMVYIHGGAFFHGAGHMVTGDVLSSFGNVIVVTINYRLGFFGFLNIGDDRAAGNAGLWDQHLALQWVNSHIGSFGGDNSRVTLFGESAGAISVAFQAMYPGNKGLFRNAIAESGTTTSQLVVLTNNVKELNILSEKIGCPVGNIGATLECVRAADTATIVQVYDAAFKAKDFLGYLSIHFLPTIDGHLIKRLPVYTIRDTMKGAAFEEVDFLRSHPLINGVNDADGACWLPWIQFKEPDTKDCAISHAQLKAHHITTGLKMATGHQVPDVILEMVAAEYTDWNNITNAKRAFVKFMGDTYFNVPMYEHSLVHSNSPTSKSWQYSFEASVGRHMLPTPSWLKNANHADELAAVFGYMDMPSYQVPDWELDLSERIMTYWTNFAKTSDPNGANQESETWPQFNIESETHIKFDRTDSTGQYLFAREHQFWRQTLADVLALADKCGDSVESTKTDHQSCDADGLCG